MLSRIFIRRKSKTQGERSRTWRALPRSTLYEGKILDGWCRAQVCEELGIALPISEPEIADPFKYAAALNDRRRHLTATQKSIVVGKLLIVANNRKPGGNGNNQYGTPYPVGSSKITAATLAKEHAIGESTATFGAAVITNGIPEVAQAVEDGSLGLKAATRIIHKPKHDQPVALKEELSKSKNGKRAVSPKLAPDPRTIEDNAQINEPSIFPADAPLPVHKSGELNTRYIQEAITELRKNEPLLGKMSRATRVSKIKVPRKCAEILSPVKAGNP